MDATEGRVHLAPDLANIVLKPLEKLLDLLVETQDELLDTALDLVQRDALASLLAM